MRWGDEGEIPRVAAELEELGYTALWLPDTGGRVFDAVERILAATSAVTVATGVLNLWRHSAEQTAAGYARIADTFGDRFLVGIGVSHADVVDRDKPGTYSRPMATTRAFLDGLDAAPRPLPADRRVLAALGPKMLALAAERSAGVHPYNVPPEHTALARAAVGPDALVLPEQAVVLSTDATEARRLARSSLAGYWRMPNYVNNWRRLGFTDQDFDAGGSDRLVDAIVAWGDEDAIAERVAAHRAAGADHVCVQVISDDGWFPRRDWRALASAL